MPTLGNIIYLSFGVALAFPIGMLVGRLKHEELVRPSIERLQRYFWAVSDVDLWCGHESKHAALISRHIMARGEGEMLNAGTSTDDESCTIHGLREQLRRLDTPAAQPKGGTPT